MEKGRLKSHSFPDARDIEEHMSLCVFGHGYLGDTPRSPASARKRHMAGDASFSERLAEAASSLQPASTAAGKEDIHQTKCNLPCSHASLLIQFVKQLLNASVFCAPLCPAIWPVDASFSAFIAFLS